MLFQLQHSANSKQQVKSVIFCFFFPVAVSWGRPVTLTDHSPNGGWPLTFPAGAAVTQPGSSWDAHICLLAWVQCSLTGERTGVVDLCQVMQSVTLREHKKGQGCLAALSFLTQKRGHHRWVDEKALGHIYSSFQWCCISRNVIKMLATG